MAPTRTSNRLMWMVLGSVVGLSRHKLYWWSIVCTHSTPKIVCNSTSHLRIGETIQSCLIRWLDRRDTRQSNMATHSIDGSSKWVKWFHYAGSALAHSRWDHMHSTWVYCDCSVELIRCMLVSLGKPDRSGCNARYEMRCIADCERDK